METTTLKKLINQKEQIKTFFNSEQLSKLNHFYSLAEKIHELKTLSDKQESLNKKFANKTNQIDTIKKEIHDSKHHLFELKQSLCDLYNKIELLNRKIKNEKLAALNMHVDVNMQLQSVHEINNYIKQIQAKTQSNALHKQIIEYQKKSGELNSSLKALNIISTNSNINNLEGLLNKIKGEQVELTTLINRFNDYLFNVEFSKRVLEYEEHSQQIEKDIKLNHQQLTECTQQLDTHALNKEAQEIYIKQFTDIDSIETEIKNKSQTLSHFTSIISKSYNFITWNDNSNSIKQINNELSFLLLLKKKYTLREKIKELKLSKTKIQNEQKPKFPSTVSSYSIATIKTNLSKNLRELTQIFGLDFKIELKELEHFENLSINDIIKNIHQILDKTNQQLTNKSKARKQIEDLIDLNKKITQAKLQLRFLKTETKAECNYSNNLERLMEKENESDIEKLQELCNQYIDKYSQYKQNNKQQTDKKNCYISLNKEHRKLKKKLKEFPDDLAKNIGEEQVVIFSFWQKDIKPLALKIKQNRNKQLHHKKNTTVKTSNLEQIYIWNRKILEQINPDLQDWYRELFKQIKSQCKNDLFLFKAIQLLRDIEFELANDKKNSYKVLNYYTDLCPQPHQTITALINLKPALPLKPSTEIKIKNESFKTTLDHLQEQIQKLKKNHPCDAKLLKQATDILKQTVFIVEKGDFKSSRIPTHSLFDDPRYSRLSYHRGALRIWEIIEHCFRLLIDKLTRKKRKIDKFDSTCFFKTRSVKKLQEVEKEIEQLYLT